MTVTNISTTLLLPLEWQRVVPHDHARIAAEATIEAILAIPEPFELTFQLGAGGDTAPSAGFTISGVDPMSTAAIADGVAGICRVLNSTQGLGTPEPVLPQGALSNWYALVPTDGAGRRIVNGRSGPWALAKESPTRSTMYVTLLGNEDTADGRLGVRCRVAVNGEGFAASSVSTLLASDPPGNIRLAAERVSSPDEAPTMVLPLSMVAHLVSSPARLHDAWPTELTLSSDELMAELKGAVPPHSVWFGGSGLGKTNQLAHEVREAMLNGSTVVVLCPHGDLAHQAAATARALSFPCDVHDFGSIDNQPRWALHQPPEGIASGVWATELVELIRSSWEEQPEEFFGPVGRRALRVSLEALVRLSGGPFESTMIDLESFFTEGRSVWKDAIEWLDDERLLRSAEEVWKSCEDDRQSHMLPWLVSKLEPLVGDPRIRGILQHKDSTVDTTGPARGGSLIASVPVSVLGDNGSDFIIGALLTRIWHEIRTERPSAPIEIFVDEVQRVPRSALLAMLTEGRKFGVRLRLATQNPSLLDSRLREAILTNSGAIGSFRIAARDGALIEPSFPQTPVGVLARLPKHRVVVSLGDRELSALTRPPHEDFGVEQVEKYFQCRSA